MRLQPDEVIREEMRQRCTTLGGLCYADVQWCPIAKCLVVLTRSLDRDSWRTAKRLLGEDGRPRQVTMADVAWVESVSLGKREQLDTYIDNMRQAQAQGKLHDFLEGEEKAESEREMREVSEDIARRVAKRVHAGRLASWCEHGESTESCPQCLAGNPVTFFPGVGRL